MTKKFDGIFLILIIIAIVIVYKILSGIFTIIADNITIIIIVILSGLGVFTAIPLYLEAYFKSKRFNHIKDSISKHTNNCNELNHYIQELKCSYLNIESYNYGTGPMTDNSIYNFHRREWNKVIQSNQIHNCSATVCKNASDQPIKYLCKYFGIKNDEESLSKFEKVLNDFTSVEQGKDLLRKEKETILRSISQSIPYLIKKYRNERLIRELGFETVDISETYIPTFTFQYVSAGGYSSSKCDIKLNIKNLNLLINYLNDTIVWSKSIAGQRALMTSQLRDKIKERDNYKCCSCGLAIEDEPNLLLEIDHKIPLSKGGMTTYDNLQTLCWRCNRAKGAKIL
ncbi:MAG TPA: HNH endonuclease [Draconibacterium sp.]|nr:HNH endonuclease [Draconibacterium sp.]